MGSLRPEIDQGKMQFLCNAEQLITAITNKEEIFKCQF